MDTDLSLTSTPTQGKPKSKAWMWILLIIFVLLIVAGVLVYFFVFDTSTPAGSKPAGSKPAGTSGPSGITYQWQYSSWPTDCPESGNISRTATCYEYLNGKETGQVDDSKCPELPPSATGKACVHTTFNCKTTSDGADYTCQKCNNPKYDEKTYGLPCVSGFECDTDTTKETCIRQCGDAPKNTSSYVCDTCGKDNLCAKGFKCSGDTNQQTTAGNNYCYKSEIDTNTYVIEDKICWPGMGVWRMSAKVPTLDNQGNLKGLWDCQCNNENNYDSQTGCSPILQHTLRLRDKLFNEEVIPYNANELQPTVIDSKTEELTATAKLMNKFFISTNSNGPAGTESDPVTMPCSNSLNWNKVVSSVTSNPDLLTQLNFGTLVDSNKVTVDNLENQWCLLDSATEIDDTTKETYNPLLEGGDGDNICSNCRYDFSACQDIYCKNGGTCSSMGLCNCPLTKSYKTENTGYTDWDCQKELTCGINGYAGQLRLNKKTGMPSGVCDCRPRNTTGAVITKIPEANQGNYGITCEHQVSGYCENEGWGDFKRDLDTYHNHENISCVCPSGVEGSVCQYTDAVTCSGHGTVQSDGSCKCKTDYKGAACHEQCTAESDAGGTQNDSDTQKGASPCSTAADCCPGNNMDCENSKCQYQSGKRLRGHGAPCNTSSDCGYATVSGLPGGDQYDNLSCDDSGKTCVWDGSSTSTRP